MQTFNKRFIRGLTRVRQHGGSEWYTVDTVHDTRHWITAKGLCGSLQVGHIAEHTNQYGAYDAGYMNGLNGGTSHYRQLRRKPGSRAFNLYSSGYRDGMAEAHTRSRSNG